MSLQSSSSILLIFFSVVALIISGVVAEVGYISIEGKSLKYWYSKPFEQVCRLDYDHELGMLKLLFLTSLVALVNTVLVYCAVVFF